MDEKLEQKVTVSDHAQAGDITLIGRVVNIIRQPATWREVIGGFLSKNWGFLLAVIVLEVALAASYFRFGNLYLIPLGLWGLAAALLVAAAWGWYAWGWLGRTRTKLVLTLLVTLALGGLVGWQTWQAVFPEHFDPQVFGIAIAELGEGPDFRRTAKAREISDQVYEHLRQAIPRRVELKRIGVMPDSQTAQAFGERLRADVVLWGQVLTSGDGGAVIRFRVLETPDRAVSPELPLVLPVTTTSTEIFTDELDPESDSVKLKRVVTQQCTIISSFTLGLVAYQDRDYPKAVEHFETTAQAVEHFETTNQTMEGSPSRKVSPNGKSLLYFYLGRVYHGIGQIEKGQEWLMRAQEANPQEPAVPLGLALGYGSLGQDQDRDVNLEQAFDLIGDWLDTHPDDNAAIYNRGIIYQIRDQWEDAALDFKAIIERDPNYYMAYISLGQVAADLKRFEKAEDALRDAIALAERTGTNSSWAHLNLAWVYEDANEPELARAEYQEAVKLAPESGWMHYSYARFLESREEMETALLAYRKMAEVSRNKGWACGILADFLKRQGLLEEALENYKCATHYQPEDALLYTHLAETYFELGDVDNALQAFEKAIEYDEELYYAYASYAGALFLLGDYERAAQMYERSLELRPLDPAVLLNLGQTYMILDQSDKAKELYLQILSLSDHFSEETTNAAHERLRALGVESP